MAIPEGRMSTTPVIGSYRLPDGRNFFAVTNFERGPIAIEDTAQGIDYQDWTLSWDSGSGDVTITPETTGSPVVITNLADIVAINFTFDQNGRVTYAYTTSVSSFLFWYDTFLGMTVTTDLGADKITPTIHMDDKRETQFAANDMLLWYTKLNGSTYDLYMLLQRERFLTEYLMSSGLEYQYIHNIGMHTGLRVQLVIKPVLPNKPYIP